MLLNNIQSKKEKKIPGKKTSRTKSIAVLHVAACF